MFYKLISKIYYINSLVFFIYAAFIFINSGCSGRNESPELAEDSTFVYQPKSSNDIIAAINFSNKVSRKTGELIGTGTIFSIKDKAKLYAVIDFKNREFNSDKDLMFHLDWIEPGGISFYKKRVDILPDDSAGTITSSISISPEKRQPGNYLLRFYLFRELIAEKKFQLVEAKTNSISTKKKKTEGTKKQSVKKEDKKKKIKPKVEVENITANITLCRYISKKTGKLIGADSTFTIKDKGKVKAVAKIENRDIKTNQQMNFYFEWIGPDGKSFYRKKEVYTTSNPSFTISNSISITPEKRKPGIYKIQIIYKKKVIAKQKFELVVLAK